MTIELETFADLLELRRCSIRKLAASTGVSVARLYQCRAGAVLRDRIRIARLARALQVPVSRLRRAMVPPAPASPAPALEVQP